MNKDYLKKNLKKGQASIEFVLILPFLIIIFIIFFQLGYCVYLKNIIEQSAREGVRVIATTNSNKKAVSLIHSNLNNKNLVIEAINILPEEENKRTVGDYVYVRIKARYKGASKILTNFIFTSFNKEWELIEAQSSMRMECSENS